MGIFHRKQKSQPTIPDAVTTYHITQSLSGKLTVTPSPPSPNAQAYSITLVRPKGFKDTIDVSIHRSASSTPQTTNDVVGHCLIEVVRGKFIECSLGDGTPIKLDSSGIRKVEYKLEVPSHEDLKWMHDEDALGGRTTPDRRLKLVDGHTGEVVARFAGAETGVSEFGVLEVYQDRARTDRDWCGLLVLTGVCVYAREERNREKKRKANDVAGFIGNWGGLLTMGVPVG